jgi:hypothetical protein
MFGCAGTASAPPQFSGRSAGPILLSIKLLLRLSCSLDGSKIGRPWLQCPRNFQTAKLRRAWPDVAGGRSSAGRPVWPARPKRHTEPNHASEAVGAHQRGMPRDWRAPVMAGDYRLRRTETIEQPYHVTDEMEQRVLIDRLGAVGPTVAAHVRSHCPEPGLGKSAKLMTPRVPGLGKPMAEQDERPFALLCHMHVYSVGVDEAVMNGHGDLRMGEGSGARSGLRRVCRRKPLRSAV